MLLCSQLSVHNPLIQLNTIYSFLNKKKIKFYFYFYHSYRGNIYIDILQYDFFYIYMYVKDDLMTLLHSSKEIILQVCKQNVHELHLVDYK